MTAEPATLRIKLKAFSHVWVDSAARNIVRTAERTGSRVKGPIPLPTRIQKFTVLRGPHIDKKSREQFEMRTHKRMIDIQDPTPQTIDALMKLELEVGVDIEIKLDPHAPVARHPSVTSLRDGPQRLPPLRSQLSVVRGKNQRTPSPTASLEYDGPAAPVGSHSGVEPDRSASELANLAAVDRVKLSSEGLMKAWAELRSANPLLRAKALRRMLQAWLLLRDQTIGDRRTAGQLRRLPHELQRALFDSDPTVGRWAAYLLFAAPQRNDHSLAVQLSALDQPWSPRLERWLHEKVMSYLATNDVQLLTLIDAEVEDEKRDSQSLRASFTVEISDKLSFLLDGRPLMTRTPEWAKTPPELEIVPSSDHGECTIISLDTLPPGDRLARGRLSVEANVRLMDQIFIDCSMNNHFVGRRSFIVGDLMGRQDIQDNPD